MGFYEWCIVTGFALLAYFATQDMPAAYVLTSFAIVIVAGINELFTDGS